MGTIKLYIKPVDVKPCGTPGSGVERSDGGRILRAEETPEGLGQLTPGTTFEAPLSWYQRRKHWGFLEIVENGEEPQAAPAEELPPEETTAKATNPEHAALAEAVASSDHKALGRALSDLGHKVPPSKVARLKIAAEVLG